METTATSTRTLEIDGMTGDACVQKVTGALKGVQNVSTKSVKVGGATIGADQAGCDAACAAVGAAGYKTREGAGDGVVLAGTPTPANTPSSVTGKTPAEHKAANLARSAEEAARRDNSGAVPATGTGVANDVRPAPQPIPLVASK